MGGELLNLASRLWGNRLSDILHAAEAASGRKNISIFLSVDVLQPQVERVAVGLSGLGELQSIEQKILFVNCWRAKFEVHFWRLLL